MTHFDSALDIETERSARPQAEIERWFSVTPAMLHSIDMKGRLVLMSDAWLNRLGYSREEVIGRLSSDFLIPESREHAIRNVLPGFRSGRCENVEYQMVCKDGRVIEVLLSAMLDNDPTNHRSSSLAVITDVTTRNAAEQQLAESEARYRGLIEDQSELVSLATPEGELRFVNHAYARLYKENPVKCWEKVFMTTSQRNTGRLLQSIYERSVVSTRVLKTKTKYVYQTANGDGLPGPIER
jgi:PAS domain S-box-containing protein